MEEGIYYKRGSKSDFASVDMLPGGADIPRIIIEEIKFHEKLTINGRKETEQWTARFAPNPWCNKEMVLNSTNKTRIAKAHWNDTVEDGTPCEGRINLLRNIAVRLTKEEARDVQNGGTTWGLRISKTNPASEAEMQKWMVEHGYAQQPQLKPLTEDKIPAALKWMQENGKGIEDVKKIYSLTHEMEEKLIAASDDLPV
jgi:hypothetical protein